MVDRKHGRVYFVWTHGLEQNCGISFEEERAFTECHTLICVLSQAKYWIRLKKKETLAWYSMASTIWDYSVFDLLGFDLDVDKISYVVSWCVAFIITKYSAENILMAN